MRKKILLGTGIFLTICLATLILVPVLYKDKIAGLIQQEANKNLNAQLSFGDVSLSLLRSFPNLNLSVKDLKIIGKGDFSRDTLIHAAEFDVTLDILSVLSGNTIEVRKAGIDQARLHFIVLKDGRANWDIAIPDSSVQTTEQPAGTFKAALNSFRISESYMSYDDREMGMRLVLSGLNTEGSGDFTEKKFTLSTRSKIEASDCWYSGIHYLNKIQTAIDADIDMDMERMRFTFLNNEIQLNALKLGIDGWVEMPDTAIAMDMGFKLKQTDFSALMSLVPGVYTEEFKDVRSTGKIAFTAQLKGIYDSLHMPGFNVGLRVDQGQFRYPSLPTGINNVNIILTVDNPDGVPDHTSINLSKLHVELGAEPFDARLSVKTPISDALVDAQLKGAVNLSNIRSMIPLDKGTKLEGNIRSDLQFKGRVSALNNKQYDAVQASGTLEISKFLHQAPADPAPTELSACKLAFSPERIALQEFRFRKGPNSLSAFGHLDNLIQYLVSSTELSGMLNIESPAIDLDALGMTSSDSASVSDTSAMQLLEVPDWIRFSINASIASLKMGSIHASNVQGSLQIADEAITLQRVACNLLGGRITLSGKYATPGVNSALVDLGLDIQNADIKQTVSTFPSTGKIAAILKQASGRYSTTMNYAAILDATMSPDLNTISGSGKLTTSGVSIQNFKPLVKVAEATKLEQFKSLPVSDLNLSFTFSDGKLTTEPFKATLGGIPCTVSGSSYFDQRIDYNVQMELSSASLPGPANQFVSALVSKANSSGASISIGKSIPILVQIGGTVSDPVVKTDLKSMAAASTTKLKEDAKALIEQQKKILEDQAKAEAEKLRKEAEEKAKKEADKLKKEAEEKARQEKERLKKEAEKKAKDALNGLFKGK